MGKKPNEKSKQAVMKNYAIHRQGSELVEWDTGRVQKAVTRTISKRRVNSIDKNNLVDYINEQMVKKEEKSKKIAE